MAVPTPQSIKAILVAGLPFSVTDLTEDRIYITEQPEKRRRFPSIEIVEDDSRESTNETNEKTEFIKNFKVVLYVKVIGGQSGDNQDEVSVVQSLEDEVYDLLDAATLGDHKIVAENKSWGRKEFKDKTPFYTRSVLSITVRNVYTPTLTPDGVLTFDVSESQADNLPASDYIYTNVFNVEIDDGYRDIDEFSNASPNPNRFAGGFRGTFIANVHARDDDLGTTADKLNKMVALRSNGEKPVLGFDYKDVDADHPTGDLFHSRFQITVDRVQKLFVSNDMTVFRIIGKLLAPADVTS